MSKHNISQEKMFCITRCQTNKDDVFFDRP